MSFKNLYPLDSNDTFYYEEKRNYNSNCLVVINITTLRTDRQTQTHTNRQTMRLVD